MTYFKDQLEAERLQGVKISDANLSLYKDNTFEAGKYLIDQLFPTLPLLYDRTKSCTASIYILPHGFMVMLSLNKGLPNFDFTGTCDGTEVDRLYCSSFHHLDLSDKAKSKLIELSKQIQATDEHGIKKKEEWELKGMPPFICMEGKWNTSRQPHGTTIDWESLILESSNQQHEAFELSLISPTWKHNAKTPNLKGKSLNHSQIHFNIWVHEPNTNAFSSEDDAVTQRIENLNASLDFIRDFESAACLLKSTGCLPQTKTNTVDFNKLEAWANLTKQIPFPHDREKYKALPKKVQEYKDSTDPAIYTQLLDNFQSLITVLKGHPELKSMIDELQQARESLTSESTLPKSKVFKGWQKKVKKIPEANALVKELRRLAQEYPLSHDPALEAALLPLLGNFFEQLPQELHFGRDFAFHQCHQEYLSYGRDLVRSQGYIDSDKLQEWHAMLQIIAQNTSTNPELDQLIAQTEKYLKTNDVLRNPGSKPQAELDALRTQRTNLGKALKKGFQQFFHVYANQNTFVEDIHQEIKRLETKKRRLAIYAFCETEAIGVLPNPLLLGTNGVIDPQKLEDCKEVVELCQYHTAPTIRPLVDQSQEYLTISRQLAQPLLQQSHPTRFTALTQQKTDLEQPILNQYRWFFMTYIRGLGDKKKKTFFEKLANYTKCPRSHTKSTAQIEFEAQPNLTKLYLTLRTNRFSQVSNLLSWIESYVYQAKNNSPLNQGISDEVQAFCKKVQDFMVRKAQSLEIVIEADWALNDSNKLHIEHSQKRSDGSEYRFKIENSRLSRDLYHFLRETLFLMGNQYTMVNQTNHVAYCKSPFLKEEVELLEELYSLLNKLFFELKIPLQWNDHLRLHEKSPETLRTQKALEAPTSYRVYKRIQEGGKVELDLLKKKDSSDLSTLEASHVALYTY